MSFTVKAPDKFSYKAEEWPQWIRRFERYRLASDLAEKESPVQVNTLIYCLGEKSEDILASFRLSAEDSGKYDVVKKKFDDYFVIRKNIIFERAKFNRRAQEEGETVDEFVTALNKLAEHCNYGILVEEMIRDRLVVGLRDAKLSEKLQLNSELTLEKAVNQARQSEAVKKQQHILRGGPSGEGSKLISWRGKREIIAEKKTPNRIQFTKINPKIKQTLVVKIYPTQPQTAVKGVANPQGMPEVCVKREMQSAINAINRVILLLCVGLNQKYLRYKITIIVMMSMNFWVNSPQVI